MIINRVLTFAISSIFFILICNMLKVKELVNKHFNRYASTISAPTLQLSHHLYRVFYIYYVLHTLKSDAETPKINANCAVVRVTAPAVNPIAAIPAALPASEAPPVNGAAASPPRATTAPPTLTAFDTFFLRCIFCANSLAYEPSTLIFCPLFFRASCNSCLL